jgi:hypothetical protein
MEYAVPSVYQTAILWSSSLSTGRQEGKMAKTKSANAIKFMLRVPPTLMKDLQKRAEQNSTSVTQEIINQLENYDARQLALARSIFKPMIESAVRSAATIAADFVLAALKDAARPSETELERRLNQLQETIAHYETMPAHTGKPAEGGEK